MWMSHGAGGSGGEPRERRARGPTITPSHPSPSLRQPTQAPLGTLAGQLLVPRRSACRRRYVSPAKSDALAFLATKETDILQGEWITAAAGKVRFGEFVDKWAEQQGHLRPRTVELYRYLLASHIRPTFDGYQLSAITNSQVGAWHRALASKLPATAPKAYRLLAPIMRAAVRDGCLSGWRSCPANDAALTSAAGYALWSAGPEPS
jgi:hypothetical protein